MLFSMLKRDFSWNALTDGQDLEAMSDHEAKHYLAFLLAAFPNLRIPISCSCGMPYQYYQHAKSPAESQPGSSTDPVS
jgi:hypothetical protein